MLSRRQQYYNLICLRVIIQLGSMYVLDRPFPKCYCQIENAKAESRGPRSGSVSLGHSHCIHTSAKTQHDSLYLFKAPCSTTAGRLDEDRLVLIARSRAVLSSSLPPLCSMDRDIPALANIGINDDETAARIEQQVNRERAKSLLPAAQFDENPVSIHHAGPRDPTIPAPPTLEVPFIGKSPTRF